MGQTFQADFAGGVPSWAAARATLQAAGLPAVLRMIDGLPAFPDEEPPPDWRELRLGLPAGMVTVRRVPAGLHFVTWGNLDPASTAEVERVVAAWQQAAAP